MADSSETIQEIAFKLMLEQNKNDKILNGTTERTIFVLGSKGVGKTTMINNFLDRNDPIRTTLALEYSYARRSNSAGQSNQNLVGNIWELGSLANSSQLIDVPIKSHGLQDFSVVIMLNLAEPGELLTDFNSALQGLKQSISNNYSDSEIRQLKEKIIERGLFKDHPDIKSLDIMPCETVIIGGKYDLFENLDSEIKKHVVKFLRSISHTLGASLIFYSTKVSSLVKTARDVMSNLAFVSPQNPIRSIKTDFNEPILISAFGDTWNGIGVMPSNSERIAIQFSSQIQQNKENNKNDRDNSVNPATDVNFREAVIDDLRAMKDDELIRLIKNSEIKLKFDSFNLNNSPFNYLN